MPHKWEKLTPCPLPNCAKPTQHRRSLESATHINKHMESLRTRKRNRGVCFLINCWEDIVLSSLLPKCHRAVARLCAFISMLFAGSKLVFLLQHGVFTQDLWVQRAWATWVRGSSGTTEAPCFFRGGGRLLKDLMMWGTLGRRGEKPYVFFWFLVFCFIFQL